MTSVHCCDIWQELFGNNDVNTLVINKLSRPFVARLVRVYPVLCTTFGYLRLELYGCLGKSIIVKWVIPTELVVRPTVLILK